MKNHPVLTVGPRAASSCAIVLLLYVTAAGCSGGDEGTDGLGCYQDRPDGADDDCQALGLPRKLQCDARSDFERATTLGCKPEDPTDVDDEDVCCPTSVASRYAGISDFCEKCRTCVGVGAFEEGFCDPFVTAGGFDLTTCVDAADTSQLADRYVSSATLAGWSCSEFDANE